MIRIASLVAALSTSACAAAPSDPIDLPPPCAPDVAARVRVDSTAAIHPPTVTQLLIPPDRPRGSAGGIYRITVTVGVDGRVIPGSVRVTSPEDAEYARRLTAWAERLRMRPATVGGCAIERETTLAISS